MLSWPGTRRKPYQYINIFGEIALGMSFNNLLKIGSRIEFLSCGHGFGDGRYCSYEEECLRKDYVAKFGCVHRNYYYDALFACCDVMFEFLQPCHVSPLIGRNSKLPPSFHRISYPIRQVGGIVPSRTCQP